MHSIEMMKGAACGIIKAEKLFSCLLHSLAILTYLQANM